MQNQLKFQRQGDSLVCVNSMEMTSPPKKNKRIISWIIIIGAGLFVLYLIDGGTGILSAGIIEAVKWTLRLNK